MSIFRQILQPRPAGPGSPALPETEEPGNGTTIEVDAINARARALNIARRVVYGLRLVLEMAVLGTVAGLLNFWMLKRDGFANVYYAAAARSMARSWHDFWYASFDPNGVMSIDKSPLAIWIQALSVRLFGFHSESILIPDAVIGVITVLVLYDLVRRCLGRIAGFVAGAALAIELQASLDQVHHGRVCPGGVEPRPRGQVMRRCELLQSFPLHGRDGTQGSAGQDLEQNHTEAEYVGALILVALPSSLLRRHVLRRAQEVARDGDRGFSLARRGVSGPAGQDDGVF